MRVDQIEIHAGAVDFEYGPLRLLEAKCEAKTNFSKSPTIGDVNLKLQEMAVGLGANAVIDVKCDSGMSMTSWRSVKATGLAVRRLSDEMPCPSCAETIKRAAKKCRFCGVELAAANAPAANGGTTRVASAKPRPHVPAEPLKATDNPMSAILIVIAILAVIAFLSVLSS